VIALSLDFYPIGLLRRIGFPFDGECSLGGGRGTLADDSKGQVDPVPEVGTPLASSKCM